MAGFTTYDRGVATTRLPQPVHPRDDVGPAPDDLESLRSFLSLHDHAPGDRTSLAPQADSLRWWLRTKGSVGDREEISDQDVAWALEVRAALVAKVREPTGPQHDEGAELLNRAAERAGLRMCFGCEEERPIHVGSEGVPGAIGTLLGAAFLAELDGRWERFRLCDDPTCSAVFYDRSRNRSGRWCSMATCGNRNKVRAFRERHASA
jgi:hypothetical protein